MTSKTYEFVSWCAGQRLHSGLDRMQELRTIHAAMSQRPLNSSEYCTLVLILVSMLGYADGSARPGIANHININSGGGYALQPLAPAKLQLLIGIAIEKPSNREIAIEALRMAVDLGAFKISTERNAK